MTRHLTCTLPAIASLILALLPVQSLTNPRGPDGTGKALPERTEGASKTSSRQDGLTLKDMHERLASARPLALYYSTCDTFGLDSVLEHATDMTVLAPQCYWIDPNGNVQGGIPGPMIDVARQAGLPVMALLYNQDFSRQVASGLLRNRTLQKQVIKKLVEISRQDNLLGFQLDFENIDPDDINLYSRFVHEAAKEFHHDGRLLSVAVVPRFIDSQPGQWSAGYDYAALGHATDFVTLMAYDNYSRLGRPGPIAGYDWVVNAIEYARRRVPQDKLLLGIPLYGREWTAEGRGFQAHTLPFPQTQALLERLSLKPQWDEKRRSPWFEYRINGIVRHVWYENARSVQEKLKLVDQFHLRGFAAWRLGMEDPRIWPLISAMRGTAPKSPERPRAATGF